MSVTSQRQQRLQRTPPSAEAAPAPVRRRRLFPATILLFLTLAAALWALPIVVAKTPLLAWLVARGASDLEGTISIGSASLGWLSPLRLEGLEVRDAAGQPVATLPTVTSQKLLWQIAGNWEHPGAFRLERPTLRIVVGDERTNIEALLARYLESSEPPSQVAASLEIVDGKVVVVDGDKQWQIESLQLALRRDPALEPPVAAEAAGSFGAGKGTFSLGLRMAAGAASGQASLTADRLPLDLVEALARRRSPVSECKGELSTSAQCQWGGKGQTGNFVQANVGVDGLRLGLEPLGGDRLVLASARAACEAAWDGPKLHLKQSSLVCDVGSASLAGHFQRPSDRTAAAALAGQTFELAARLDAAALARMLPRALAIQAGTTIDAAVIDASLAARPEAGASLYSGRLTTGDVRATHAGRQFTWEQPLQLNFALRHDGKAFGIDSLRCDSTFLKAEAAGTADALTANANFDLNQLAVELGRFVDLGGLRLVGQGGASARLNRQAEGYDLVVQLGIKGLELAVPQVGQWAEPSVALELRAVGKASGEAIAADTASLRLQAGEELLDLRLTAPVRDLHRGPWPLESQGQGRLDAMAVRLARFLPAGWQASGRFNFAAKGTATTTGATFDSLQLAAAPFALATPSVAVNEPNLRLEATEAKWDRAAATAAVREARVESPTVVAAVSGAEIGAGRIVGRVEFQAALDRLQSWFQPPSAGGWRLQGALAGRGSFERSGDVGRGQIDATASNVLVTGAEGQFREPQMRLVAAGTYTPASGELQLTSAELTSGLIAGKAAGRLLDRGGRREADLSATAQYDLARLAEFFRASLGPHIQLAGRGTAPLTLSGPLGWAESQGSASMAWSSIAAYGFRAGPSELKTRLSGGVLTAEPIDVEVNGGRMQLRPTLRLAGSAAELHLAPGQVARQLRIDPEMSRSALAYALPALADAAEADGTFSVELDKCRLPLSAPAAGEVAGRITVHTVQIGVGPLLREFAVALGRETPARLTRESVIPFELRAGRVYHEGMELVFPDVTVRTRGSVGLDHTLDLVASMPVPPKWLQNNPLAATLKNQLIELPIAGTLQRPALDRRRLAEASARFMGNAARNVLEDRVKQQLDRLFGPPQ